MEKIKSGKLVVLLALAMVMELPQSRVYAASYSQEVQEEFAESGLEVEGKDINVDSAEGRTETVATEKPENKEDEIRPSTSEIQEGEASSENSNNQEGGLQAGISESQADRVQSEDIEEKEENAAAESECPAVQILERDGGVCVEGIVFSSDVVIYRIQVTGEEGQEDSEAIFLAENEEQKTVLRYKVGELEGCVLVENYLAEIVISEDVNDMLQVWYGCNGNEYLVIEEYLLIERQAPEVSCERMGEGVKQYALITMTDAGNIRSGLQEWRIIMDGEIVDSYNKSVLDTVNLPNGLEMPEYQEISIPLAGEDIHEIKIQVYDCAGNVTEESITIQAVPENIGNIVLPDSFQIVICPRTEEKWQIYSDDIEIRNENDFPVEVEVTVVELYVNHEFLDGVSEPVKDCEVNFQLRQNSSEVALSTLAEGLNEDVLHFTLSAGYEGSELPESALDRPDCAVINLCGMLRAGSEQMWKAKDLKVNISFRFKRAVEEEEQEYPEDTAGDAQQEEQGETQQDPEAVQLPTEEPADGKDMMQQEADAAQEPVAENPEGGEKVFEQENTEGDEVELYPSELEDETEEVPLENMGEEPLEDRNESLADDNED